MNWKLRQLQGFLAAARLGTFSAAADQLAMTQPAFSQLIRDLEASLHIKLIERTTRRFQLTEAGERLLATIERPLSDLSDAYGSMLDFAAGSRGRITLCSVAYGFVVTALGRLKARYPGITVRLIEDQNLILVRRVLDREVDFGIGALSTPSKDLAFRELLRDELMAVYPASHALARKRMPTWQDLAANPLVLMPRQTSTRELAERGLTMSGVAREPDYEVANAMSVLNIVRAGLGVTLMPRIMLGELNMQGLRASRLANPHPRRSIGIIKRADRSFAPAAAAYVELLVAETQGMATLPRSSRL